MSADRGLSRPGLRLIHGGLEPTSELNGVGVVVAPRYRSPFSLEAIVEEEDTYLVLSADPVVKEPVEHPVRLMTALWDIESQPLGSIVVKAGVPLRLLAVVHDLNADPTWREEWVAAALAAVFAAVRRRRIRSLGLPVLGARHGSMDAGRFASLLGEVLAGADRGRLERLWLICGEEEDEPLRAALGGLDRAEQDEAGGGRVTGEE